MSSKSSLGAPEEPRSNRGHNRLAILLIVGVPSITLGSAWWYFLQNRPQPIEVPTQWETILADDFEGESLAEFWAPGNYGAGRYEPGAIGVSDERAKTGGQSVRITVKEGDIEQDGGDPGIKTERAELDSGKYPLLGATVRARFSFFVPEDFPIVDVRLVIAQWKQKGSSGPNIAQRYRNGRHYVSFNHFSSTSRRKQSLHELPAIRHGHWHEMEYLIKFDSEDGFIRVKMDGESVAWFDGPTANPNGTERFYNKFGLYRDRWPDPMTIFFDDYEYSMNTADFEGGEKAAEEATPAE